MSNIRPDLSIEYSYVRVPYDSGVKSTLNMHSFLHLALGFKTSKKTVEKEMSSILNSIIALKKENHLNKTQTTSSLSSLITRLKSLKRKLDENYHEEDEIYECCKKRLLQLNSLDPQKKESIAEFQNSRVHYLVIEYLVRNNYNDTAKAISDEYGMKVID